MSGQKLINGQFAEQINLADRGLQFGDGVFRTIKVCAGQPIWWPRHYAKLVHDCQQIGIRAPSEATLLADIAQLQQSAPPDHTLKIIITRGETARGYVAPADLAPNRIVQIAPPPAYPADLASIGVTLRLCTTRASWQPALAGVKHLNRLENILARREWQDACVFDGLMFDRDDHLIEGVMSNVWLLIDGVLCTPDLSSAGVAGVYRDIVMAAAALLAIPVRVCEISRAQLVQAQAVWVCNSLAGLLPVVKIAEQHWPIAECHAALLASIAHLKESE